MIRRLSSEGGLRSIKEAVDILETFRPISNKDPTDAAIALAFSVLQSVTADEVLKSLVLEYYVTTLYPFMCNRPTILLGFVNHVLANSETNGSVLPADAALSTLLAVSKIS